MADALDSKSSEGDLVRVQVPPSAPSSQHEIMTYEIVGTISCVFFSDFVKEGELV